MKPVVFRNLRRIFVVAVFSRLALFSASLSLGNIPPQVPRGVFSLGGAGSPASATVLANPDVDGLSIRQDWADLEPSEGVYNFSFLDSEVARAAAAGKVVLLRISTQLHKPAWVTSAVTQAGGKFFSFSKDGVPTTIPVFWDPTFLAKKKAMITALGAHFATNPTVKIVWASFANSSSEDWSVPHTSIDLPNWQAVGYSSDLMLGAGREIIAATMAAFPNQYVTLAVAPDGSLDPDADYVSRNSVLVTRALWPSRLIVQKNSLSAFNANAPGTNTIFQLLWDSRPAIAAQMLDGCFNDDTYRMNNGVAGDPATILHTAIDKGLGYGTQYLEIYEQDVVNLPAEITYAHTALLNATGATSFPGPPRSPAALRISP